MSRLSRLSFRQLFEKAPPKPLQYRLSSSTTPTNKPDKIEIPKRISRGPTDILRALESTVSRDPTAAHYKYHDDPYLIPKSNVGKRTFAMAQEAGRKAALWIRQEHSELFRHKEADPPVQMFYPKATCNEESEVTEEDLLREINNVQVSDAVTIYKNLTSKSVCVSFEAQQSLLELLCYHNSADTLSEHFIEERWFRQSNKGKERTRKTWLDGGLAEEIFVSIDKPNAETYSAIIQGMAKHYQIERAWQLFEEALQKQLAVSVDTFNSIISVANFIKEGYDLRWNLVVQLLTQMKTAGLRPNLGTLNAILHCLSTMGSSKQTRQNVLKMLVEFKNLGIETSLGSWYYVMITFCKERGPTSTILYDIMNEVENKEHKIRDLVDVNFFVTAMDICRNHLQDVDLAKRVDQLLHFGNNYDLIGDSYKESIYYRHYFILMCQEMPLLEFMETCYEKLVPHIYVPEPTVMGEIIKQVELNGAVEYIPKLWSDMIVFDHVYREKLLDQLLNAIVNNLAVASPDLNEPFAQIGMEVYNLIEGQDEEKTNRMNFTGEILGNILLLLSRNGDFSGANKIFEKLDKGVNTVIGVPKPEALSSYVDVCIENKSPTRAINCVQYCVDNGYPEVTDFVKRLTEKLTLDERYLEKLSKLVDLSFVDQKM